ncbi:MAG: hypothetical protein Q8O67_31585 [Deltaproteobacteria bacterium]|nr:hypothetical protein [Deltaproteobacteria bacterium]
MRDNTRRAHADNARESREPTAPRQPRERAAQRQPTEPELRELPGGQKIQWRFTRLFLETEPTNRRQAVLEATAIASRAGLPLSKEGILERWEKHTQKAIEAYRVTQKEDPQMDRGHLAFAALWCAAVRCGGIARLEHIESANDPTSSTARAANAAPSADARKPMRDRADGAGGPARESPRETSVHAAAVAALEKARPGVSEKGREHVLALALGEHIDGKLGPKEAAGAFAEQMQALRNKMGQGDTVQKMLAFATLSLVRPHTEIVREVKSQAADARDALRTEACARIEGMGSTDVDRKKLETLYVESGMRELLFPGTESQRATRVAAMAISEHQARSSGVSTDWQQLGDDLLS